MLTVNSGNLGSMAAEAQTGLGNATLISQTLQLLNGKGSAPDPSLEIIGAATKNLVNAAMGKGLNIDSMA